MNQEPTVDDAFDRVKSEFPIADYIDESVRYQMRFLIGELRQYLPDFHGTRLLDIGSGPMDKTSIFQVMGFECYAADDLSNPWHQRNENISKIQSFAKRIGINFFQQQSGNYSIPFELGSFDVVCSLAVIEHLHESPRTLLNTMGMFAKEEGLIVITMPNSVNLRKRLSVFFGRTNHVPVEQLFFSTGMWRGHVREYTLSEAEYICKKAGFEILAAKTCEHLAQIKLKPPFQQFYTFVGNIIPTLRSSLLVLCRKPKNWTPLEPDSAAFREALKKSVPKGVS